MDAIISFICIAVSLVTVGVKCEQFAHVYVVIKSPINTPAISDPGYASK